MVRALFKQNSPISTRTTRPAKPATAARLAQALQHQ
jgi:hypothetical protein